MTTKDMLEIVEQRQQKSQLARAKVDDLYTNTKKLLYALEEGKDKDWCFNHWVKLIEAMDGFSTEEREYYSKHASGLVHLIEDYVKLRRTKDE